MGRSRSYVSLVRRSRLRRKAWSEATGGSSDESSHAPCDTCAYRYPRDVGLRFTARWIESRREGVANGYAIRESVGSKPLPLEFEERASALRTTRRNASRSCSMPPKPRHGVGARFSQVGLAECRRKPMHGAGSCRLAFGPEQGGACENDHGRERSDSAEQGFSSCTRTRDGAGGQHRSQKLHRQRTSFARRSTARCLGERRGRSKQARFTARHLKRGPGARTHGARMQPPIGRRNCLITFTV